MYTFKDREGLVLRWSGWHLQHQLFDHSHFLLCMPQVSIAKSRLIRFKRYAHRYPLSSRHRRCCMDDSTDRKLLSENGATAKLDGA